jgi:hypothetical protein
MNTTEDGSKKPSQSKELTTVHLTAEEATKVIQMVAVGTDETALAAHMEPWTPEKKQQAWQVVAEYFKACSQFNAQFELGRAVARLNLLFKNSLQIQDFKACLSIQKEINKLLALEKHATQ